MEKRPEFRLAYRGDRRRKKPRAGSESGPCATEWGLPLSRNSRGLLAQLGKRHPILIGYAADGFPIYAQTPENRSSYRLKSGTRPTGAAGPGGSYDGTYTADYDYVKGLGDLDEANGRTGATPEYPQGTYYYVATAEFPFYPRMLKGTPDASFRRGPPGGGAGGGSQNRGLGESRRDSKPGRGDMIQRLDQNGDGKISREEAPSPMQRNFLRHDTNGDGFIDAEEAKSLPRPGQGDPRAHRRIRVEVFRPKR